MTDPPISVIICTRDRPASFQRALDSVLAQDYDGFEVIVVDGSEPPVDVGTCTQPPMRVLRAERRGEGPARAAGLRAARGDLIAWCDDDDEWLPGHLRALHAGLLARPDCVLAAYGIDEGTSLRGAARGTLPIPAGDVLHYAAASRAAGGLDHGLRTRAAADLWARMAEYGAIAPVPGAGAIHHAFRKVATPEERRQAAERLRRDRRSVEVKMLESAARLDACGAGVVPFDPETWREGRRELIFQTTIRGEFSLAVLARMMSRALLDLGVWVTLGRRRERVDGVEWEPLFEPLEPENRLALICEPRSDFRTPACEIVVRYLMWETTHIPRWQVDEFNRMLTMLYVPCHELANSMRANGVEVPVRVLHHGIDPQSFPYLERARTGSEPFVFGCHAALQPRKGTDILIRAFQEEFRPGEDVRLALKHTFGMSREYVPNDERIVMTGGFVDSAALLEFLRGLDAYVLPSRGEGFGLTGLEAMATGLPLIATNWSGPAEFLDPADTYPLGYRMTDVGGIGLQNYRDFGEWAEPDLGHLRELMRYLYEHREEGAEAGRRASARAHRGYTWQRVAEQVVADFDLLARGVTPLAL